MDAATWSLKARWIAPVCAPPIENGVLEITGQHITKVRQGGEASVDLGDVLVVPGLVNAHTHLDLTGFPRGGSPPETFADWIRQVIRHRRAETRQDRIQAIRQGVAKSLLCGVTLLGDITSDGASLEYLAKAPLNATVYHEVLGVNSERAEEFKTAFDQWRSRFNPLPNIQLGISPHAPYSTRLQLFSWARGKKLPTQVHLAETAEELQLMQEGRGPLVEMLRDIGLWPAPELASSLEAVLEALDLDADSADAPVALVHGNWVPTRLASNFGKDVTLIHCPRTHAWFNRPPFPAREWLDWGVGLALGTDGEACNPDLDILAEARFLHRQNSRLSPREILEMVTIQGARALGWGALAGSLESGKLADLAVFRLENPGGLRDPLEALLGQDNPPQAVLWRGAWRSG